MPTGPRHSGRVIHRQHGYKYRFFFQGSGHSLFQVVRICGDDLEVLFERVRSIRVDKRYPILQHGACLRQIASLESACNRATAKGVGEFSIQSCEQLLIGWLRQIREIDFNPCLFGWRQ